MSDHGNLDPGTLPWVLAWAGPGAVASGSDLAAWADALGPDCCTLGFDRPGTERLSGSLEAAIATLQARHPDRDLLVLRADLALPPQFPSLLAALVARSDRPDRVLFPGSYRAELDPLRDLELGPVDLGRLVAWSADRVWQPVAVTRHEALLLKPGAAPQGDAVLFDDGYLTGTPAPDVPSDRLPDPPADPLHGHLARRVDRLVAEGGLDLPEPDAGPVTLHIAHSWGGGVWRWIEDFAAGSDGVQLVLMSVSDDYMRYCGRRLKLCALGPGRGVLREIALAPQIPGTAAGHAGYRAALTSILERFGVGRVIVSTLIGHSLDALTTGRPTIQVLHDFHPVWPLLDRDPMPFLEAEDGRVEAARAAALATPSDRPRLPPADPVAWDALAEAWRAAVSDGQVALVAPTRHVADRWKALNPAAGLNIRILPHGFRAFDRTPAERPSVEAPLHLLIPGRLNAGKGLELLEAALPRLAGRVRLTALGCGPAGQRLFGRSGVDLVSNYERDALPDLVDALKPHAALLLSTVPETWSYTLSEMRALGLPVLATRLGSFVERVEDGVDGLLFEPEVDALVACIESLIDARDRLDAMARRVPDVISLEAMIAAYDAVASSEALPVARPGPGDPARVASDWTERELAVSAQDARRAQARIEQLDLELARRGRWAETMERQFHERSRWAERLEARRAELEERVLEQQRDRDRLDREHHAELDRKNQAILALETARDQLAAERDRLAGDREQLAGELDHLSAERERILASRSWRITRPLRVASRLLGGGRLRKLANPLNWWPMLQRFLHHWRLRGLKQTLVMLQSPTPEAPPPEAVGPTPVPQAGRIAAPVRMAAVESPRVSVIVPVYNQLHFTAACLRSLVRARNETPFEVIVVDDGSSDGTARWLKRCKGVRALKNPRNLGFIGTCNRGAEAARGEYLVFLNNDTEVRDGWIDALLDVFEQRPDAGVVGGKLVFADGSLQEAGGLVFDDGSGWNYGRGDDPARPQYEFVAECDYVSGACLAIERERFAALGGFDSHYAPAYYEDTDLCFKVRAQGLKVYVQPAATIVHFEGATSGTDENAETGAKRYQKVNREKFLERWADALASQPPNAPDFERADPVRALRHHRLPHRALVIDATTPMPDHDSGSVRMFALLKLLVDLGYQTSFMPENRSWAGRHSVALQQAGIEVLSAPWVTDLEAWLVEHGAGLDLVLVSRHYILAPILKLIREYCPNAKLVFDTVDLHFLREQREAELAGTAAARRAAERTRQQEMALIHAADATLVVSAFERDLLAEAVPEAEVHIVSNIHSLQDPGKPFEDRADLLFVGGFQHPPNIDAAEWLIDDILPRVREQLPDVELHLIGSKMPDSLARRRAPGLRCHGFVADLEPYLASTRVSVAPLRYGAGVKGKVNQAMSHGLPVVATSCAAEGMFTTQGKDILMADDAERFAAEVVRVYQDAALWKTLAEGGRANVETYFSVAAARRALEGLLGVQGSP